MQPPSRLDKFSTPDDWAASQSLLWGGSRTFMAASLLLPARVRQAAIGLYAFCRTADDAVDSGGEPGVALARLRGRLEQIYAGRPRCSVDCTFADVVVGYAIPRVYADALLEGFEWDAAGRRYETLDDLCEYAMRVAGIVGAMMAVVMGVDDETRMARACDLGVAMQLTNIARDVGEDARNGRCYLPLDWMREAGVDADAWLRDPQFDVRIARVIERLLDVADALYRRSEAGLNGLPRQCRTGMYAARYLYDQIGAEVRRQGFDSVGRRAVVPSVRKSLFLCKALLAGVAGGRPEMEAGVMPQADFVLRALPSRGNSRRGAPAHTSPVSVSARVEGVFDLFERLARRDLCGGTPSEVS